MVLLRLRSIAACGNCKIEYGTYTGDGTKGRSLTFSAKPAAVFIQEHTMGGFGIFLQGSTVVSSYHSGKFTFIRCGWTENGVTTSAYTADATARDTFNAKGEPYSYAALLPMDE